VGCGIVRRRSKRILNGYDSGRNDPVYSITKPTQTRGLERDGQERMLVFRMGQLGDMMVSLPSVWAIRRQWPQASLTLLCDVHPGRNYVLGSEIFRGAGLFDSFEHYEVPGVRDNGLITAMKQLTLLFRLRAKRFKTLFYLAPSIRLKTQVERDRRFFKAAGVERFYGMENFPSMPSKDSPRPLPLAGHEADLLLGRLKADGIKVPGPGEGSLDLGLGEQEAHDVREWLRQLPTDRGRPWLGVGPASKMPAKRWPLDRFNEVVRALISQFDAWPVVFGGVEDKEIGEALLASWGRGFNAAGALGVRAAAWALQRCALFLGNDSGTMHLAAAGGTPCVAVFSSRDWPGAWYPYGVEQRVFRSEIECEGCYLTECVERRNECLNRISAMEVGVACEKILNERLGLRSSVGDYPG
jgi:lipopolysaccharide heptosyltransferase III